MEEWKAIPDDATFINALMRQALQAVEEVMGAQGLNIVLHEAGLDRYVGNLPPNNLETGVLSIEYARLNAAIENFYGRAGKGFLRRIGRASFQYGVREQAALLGVAGVALKFMPQRTRMKFILTNVAKALMKTDPHANIVVEEKDNQLLYSDLACSLCQGRESDVPICHLYIGSLEEALKWATGNEIAVEEIKCRAKHDPCCQFAVALP
jgi:hypothetical protein